MPFLPLDSNWSKSAHTSASRTARMILARNSELLTEARYSATPKLVATAFEAVQLIKPPAPRGVSDYRIHKAQAVQQWLAAHPRFEVLWLPTYCPRAHPIERAFGDTHDKVTRHHKRKRLRDLVADVGRHLDHHGPWPYQLSRLYQEPEVTAALQILIQEKHAA